MLAFLAAPSTDMNLTFTRLSPTLLYKHLSFAASRSCKKEQYLGEFMLIFVERMEQHD